MIGFAADRLSGAPNVLAVAKGREWVEGLRKAGDDAAAAALDLIATCSQLKIPKQKTRDYSPGSPIFAGVRESIMDAAEKCEVRNRRHCRIYRPVRLAEAKVASYAQSFQSLRRIISEQAVHTTEIPRAVHSVVLVPRRLPR